MNRLWLVNNNDDTLTNSSSGAIATHIHETAAELRSTGVEVNIVSRAGDPDDLSDDCFQVRPAANSRRRLRLTRRAFGLRDLGQAEYHVDVLCLLRSCSRAGDAVLFHNDPELATLASWLLRGRRVGHLMHNHLVLRTPWPRLVSRSSVVQIAVSSHVAHFAADSLGLRRVGVALNGVDLFRFKPGAPTADVSPVTIGFTGRTGREKGLDLLLRACLQLPEGLPPWRLQTIGSNRWGGRTMDNYQVELDALYVELAGRGVEVRREGHVGRADLPAILSRADVLVVPSRWDEPSGLVTLEGLATGLALIASDTGGSSELLEGVGLMFPRDDVDALSAHLFSVISDETLRAGLQMRARIRAEDLSWARTAATIASLLGL